MALVMGASRDVMQMVLLMTLLVCGLTAASRGCPRGCHCDMETGTVICNNIDSFPTEFPLTARKIRITGGYLKEIPTGAFDNLPLLEFISFSLMTIGTIQRRAFYRIGRNVQYKVLMFDEVTIENIKQEAFEELNDFKSLSISSAKLFNVSSGAFSKLSNIRIFFLSSLTVPTLRSDTFITFRNVSTVGIDTSTIDVIEEEAFSNFTHVGMFELNGVRVGTLGSRFITSYKTESVIIRKSTFELWQECSFCGIRATRVQVVQNIVHGTEGNVFKGIRVVELLGIDSNSLPFIVARFFPVDLPDETVILFSNNSLTTIRCEGLGTDYPTDIIYSFTDNEVTCDCRLNWMWKKWSKTHAAQTLTPGFVCAGPERQSLSDYLWKVSASEITPPCDGVEPVDDCGDSVAAATSKASGMSVLAVILLSLMAS